MKKYLPIILVGLGVVVVVVILIIVFKNLTSSNSSPNSQEVSVPDLPQSEWPVVTLTPTEDPTVPNSLGHFLDFKVQKINVANAKSMDYELIYSTTNGGQQGVPGTVQLTGDVDRKLLLGSESSGHFRFDAGVDHGTMTIRFRDGSGKLIGKLSTEFHLQFGDTVLTSTDGKFTYTLDKVAKGVYFITMPTFVQPADATTYVVWQNGYGVFASDGLPHTGK